MIDYRHILERYDHIVTTGHTGEWVIGFLEAGDKPTLANRVLRCKSGPDGGDVQICHAVLANKIRTVVFFQDPGESHVHEVDIRFFEQAAQHPELAKFKFARNPATARSIVDSGQ